MEEILTFAKGANLTVILCLAMIAIIILLLGGNRGISIMLGKIFRKQKLTDYKVEGGKASLDSIAKQLETIAGNHLHNLPQISKDIIEIKKSVKQVSYKQNRDSERIAKIEGRLGIDL